MSGCGCGSFNPAFIIVLFILLVIIFAGCGCGSRGFC